MLSDPSWSGYFKTFLEYRAQAIFGLIDQYVITPSSDMSSRHGVQAETPDIPAPSKKPRFKDIVASGRIKQGDRLYTRKNPDRIATVVDGETVEYEGLLYPINVWGEKATGWSSINIYDSVILERTGQALRSLREDETAPEGE